MGKVTEKQVSYDEMIAQAEQIIEKLQTDTDMPVDKMVEETQRAIELMRQCKKQLTDITEKLDKLFVEEEKEG